MNEREVYLGDGVYASFDGYQIWLRTPRSNGDHSLALEPRVLAALDEFRAAVSHTEDASPSEPKEGK